MTFSNKAYDTLKWIAQYLLPGIGTLYFTLASIWGFPYAEQVVGSITAIDTLLGLLLGISSANYKGDGTLVVKNATEDGGVVSISLDSSLENIIGKSSVTFMVDSSQVNGAQTTNLE